MDNESNNNGGILSQYGTNSMAFVNDPGYVESLVSLASRVQNLERQVKEFKEREHNRETFQQKIDIQQQKIDKIDKELNDFKTKLNQGRRDEEIANAEKMYHKRKQLMDWLLVNKIFHCCKKTKKI